MGYTGAQKREYNRLWMKARRDSWFEGQSCTNCGSTERLEVDHVDPTTKRWEPASLWSRKESDRLEELAKCQALCHDCHVDKSAIEKMSFQHGATQYKKGCRCDVCREAQRVRIAAWRANQESSATCLRN
jgi:hypothetical protein